MKKLLILGILAAMGCDSENINDIDRGAVDTEDDGRARVISTHHEPLVEALAPAIEDYAVVSAQVNDLGFGVATPTTVEQKVADIDLATCQEIGTLLQSRRIERMSGPGDPVLDDLSHVTTEFLYAHTLPKCSVRIHKSILYTDNGLGNIQPVIAFDLVGTPVEEVPAHCGDGIVDDGEMCDDGNHQLWDGCDSQCNWEEFNGCEHVIEGVFNRDEVADVPADLWRGPSSHVLLHQDTKARITIDEDSCHNEVLESVTEVCSRLTGEMSDVVSWCQPVASYSGDACHVRLNVHFYDIDPDMGVFTTGLPGLLEFTLK